MNNTDNRNTNRLHSLDALRGFDMFWIMGGEGIFVSLAAITGWPVFNWCALQLEHVEWHGFVFYDMIFPLFLFIAGISFPFSFRKRTERGLPRKLIYRHILFRGLILVALGIIYNNGIRFNLEGLRYGSVLGRIGLAWMFAALIFINTKLVSRIIIFWSILVLYWLLFIIFPAHDLGSSDIYSQEGNFASHIDRLIMPGRLYRGNHDPEGLMSTLPAICTALLGMFTGEFLLAGRFSNSPYKRVLVMAGAAVTLMVLGKVWDLFFPINKNLWSSSFVLYVGGLSLLLFTIFYLVIDVWNLRKWAFFFVVIGMNPITIYLVQRIVDFESATKFFFGGFSSMLPENWTTFVEAIGITAISWIFLYLLYRKKIFLKV